MRKREQSRKRLKKWAKPRTRRVEEGEEEAPDVGTHQTPSAVDANKGWETLPQTSQVVDSSQTALVPHNGCMPYRAAEVVLKAVMKAVRQHQTNAAPSKGQPVANKERSAPPATIGAGPFRSWSFQPMSERRCFVKSLILSRGPQTCCRPLEAGHMRAFAGRVIHLAGVLGPPEAGQTPSLGDVGVRSSEGADNGPAVHVRAHRPGVRPHSGVA